MEQDGGRSTRSSARHDGKQRNVDCYNQALRLADISGTLTHHLIDQRYRLDAAILDTTPCRTSSSVKVILSSVMTITGGSPGPHADDVAAAHLALHREA